MPYNVIRIQQFLANRINLQNFCFHLQFNVNETFAYQFLPGLDPVNKSMALVDTAQRSGQLGDVVYQLIRHWRDEMRANPHVLLMAQMDEELEEYRQQVAANGEPKQLEQIDELLQWINPESDPPHPGGGNEEASELAAFHHGYAVLIGVGDYRDPGISSLPATVNDVYALQEVFRDKARCAYPGPQVNLCTGPVATRQAILDALDWLADKASIDPEATAVFYFSGHGYEHRTGPSTDYYLIPCDGDLNQLAETAVSGEIFTQKLRAIRAKRLVVIFDACHAGGMTKDVYPLPKGVTEATPPAAQLAAQLGAGAGRVVLSSSQNDQQSYVNGEHSIFTTCLVEALSGRAATTQPGYIGILDVYNYLGAEVPKRAQQISRQQQPVLDGESMNNFPIALAPK